MINLFYIGVYTPISKWSKMIVIIAVGKSWLDAILVFLPDIYEYGERKNIDFLSFFPY